MRGKDRMMPIKEKMSWYNYDTEKYEAIDTPDDFTSYIPNIPAARSLYSLLVKMGNEPIEAARQVLEAGVK